jgi:aryl-alcohol dehydrogenase-like predicted oxidoreductase
MFEEFNKTMNFKKLGNTNLKVSSICLGTMTWGEQNTEKDAFEQMDYAVEHGINFFDTAELYAVPMKPETRAKTILFLFVVFKNHSPIN